MATPTPSLAGESGFFRVTPAAPESTFSRADANGDIASGGGDSTFGPSSVPVSDFRLAEVAADRIEETRGLLSQLGAKQGADQSIRFLLPADILFDFDKASLRPDAEAPLRKAARLISAYPQAPLTVTGYTDAKGEDAYNDRLSLARARAVWTRLAEGRQREADVKGLGERNPVAPNARPDGSDDVAGRQLNRRVEIVVLPSAATTTER